MARRPPFSRNDKDHVNVLGTSMAYVERGSGDPIVFLHGNPTSSFLWRKVVPEVWHLGRCIVPDLVGMGDSEKVFPGGPNSYRFIDHRTYLEGLLDVLGATERVTLVGHDWGGALAFDWANHHREAVKGIAYMETLVTTLSWDDWPGKSRPLFEAMRSAAGEEICLIKNVFVERILPGSVLDPLPPEVMDEYRRPYREPGESRRPTLSWPRELPIDGQPAAVARLVDSYGDWLASSPLPKLFINADPGSILVGRPRQFCRGWPNQTEVTVRGLHFIQEDSGPEVGEAIANWYRQLG
jgi:haloalkane dehalogenase